MQNDRGYWFGFPTRKGEQDGQEKYFDFIYTTPQEREHIRRLIMLELGIESQADSKPRYDEDQQMITSPITVTDDDIPF